MTILANWEPPQICVFHHIACFYSPQCKKRPKKNRPKKIEKKVPFFSFFKLHSLFFNNFFNSKKNYPKQLFQKISIFPKKKSRRFSKKGPLDMLFAGLWNLSLSSFTFFLLSLWRRKKKSLPFFFKGWHPRRRRKETTSSFCLYSNSLSKDVKELRSLTQNDKSLRFCHSGLFSVTKKIEKILFPNLFMTPKRSFSFYTKMKTLSLSFRQTLHSAYELYEALQSYGIKNATLFC